MKRVAASLTLVLFVAPACSAPPEATPENTNLSSTFTTTTTTTVTTTPAIPDPDIVVEGAPPELVDLIRALYGLAGEGPEPLAPRGLIDAFAASEGTPPSEARAAVARWDEEWELGVVEADGDVTLAVADPEWRVVGGWWPSMEVGRRLGKFPKLIAVVGSDARPKERRDETRTDSIHFVGIDGEGAAGVVGVPRDAWVALPGRGNSRINAALVFGGTSLMMDTFTEVSGLDFDGYLLTGFAGFESLIGILGGLDLDVPMRFDDDSAKAYFDAGRQLLDPAQALGFTRARKTLPAGDFQRQEHGGLAIMAAQVMVRAMGLLALPDLVAASRPHVSTDMDPAELLMLAAAVAKVRPENVVNAVAPGRTGMAGSASVVFLTDGADDLFADLADGTLADN
ncbi:hypothetical protein BH23ACT5_BH23ACT5_00910 [soil metagenome]